MYTEGDFVGETQQAPPPTPPAPQSPRWPGTVFFFSIYLFQFIPDGTAVLQLLSNRRQDNNKSKCKIPENYPTVSLPGPDYLAPLKTIPRRHFGSGFARCNHQRAVSTVYSVLFFS